MDLPSGLVIVTEFITASEETALLEYIDAQEWFSPAKNGRRVQHYGYRYNYLSKSAKQETTPIPPLMRDLCDRLTSTHGEVPNQVIVNEYTRKQGIAAHIDAPLQFGPVITTVSLGDEAVMVFHNSRTGQSIEVLLPPRSAVSLSGDARYEWTHSIPNRVTYTVDGQRRSRGENWRRVSVTFRSVL